MAVGSTKVVQVTNIAPQATKDQMHILFGYLGKIEDIRLYPTIRDVSCPVQSRICYIKFVDVATVGIAQHMTNTVFIDRALIVIPVSSGEIPDEYYALEMTRNGTIVPGLTLNEPKLPPHVVNSVQGSGADQVIITTDHHLDGNSLPSYPPLPSTYDTAKIEETRRTILLLNFDSTATNDEIIDFFSTAGEVKYLRTCTKDSDNTSHILIEFTDQSSIINALKMNGLTFKGQPIEIQHATQPIIKPQAKSNEAAQKEIEEAMSRFKEAQNMINASIEPVIGMLTKDKRSSRRSRSRSRGRRRRSRSRSRSRRSRSRRRRSSSRTRRSKSRDRRRRSKSRSRRRSHSRSRRSRSRSSKSRRSRSKSNSRRSGHRSREHTSRAKSRERDRRSRDRSRDRKRSRDRDRKSRERESKEKAKEKPTRDSKEKRSDKENSVDVPEKKRSRTRSKSRRRSRSKDRKTKEKRRSRSRGSRRRSPSPRPSRKRSRTRSRDRKRDKKNDRKDKDRKEKDKKSRSRSRSTRSHSKIPRNYDEEERGFDADKDKSKEKDCEMQVEKESSEKSDNMDISNSP
ncbi:probable splicing factor, arginine/serine-rich 7 [Anoplophora glabripennis]|uniref:probable splicing factor, arginine/serine-rich 7 n=1 Tax=Anoplophora glabripennis TaxID=217634 RepID=UPI0008755803|nr:probable splicing factor, arginine/serine-rich 7 [Anoplophora glabripennis]